MKAKVCLLLAAVCFFVVLSFAAESPFMGTWKLNEAKSKIAAGTQKNNTVVYEAAGDNTKVTVDGTTAKGESAHNEWTGKFDGKEYPVTGDSISDTRSYKQVDAHTMTMEMKKGGKVTETGEIVVSPDGKSRTVTVTIVGADGKKSTSTVVYDKQ